jgi:hypothetical protein
MAGAVVTAGAAVIGGEDGGAGFCSAVPAGAAAGAGAVVAAPSTAGFGLGRGLAGRAFSPGAVCPVRRR